MENLLLFRVDELLIKKQIWILAGGNGAGKTTFFRRHLKPRGMRLINADLIAKQLDKEYPERVSYQAARIAEKLRTTLLENEASFCFETVFSHESKIDFVGRAKGHGYQLVLAYIHLTNTELNQARVMQRVAEGGHHVPPDKIVSRIPRTMQHIRVALPLFDYVQLYDNSFKEEPFQNVANIKAGTLNIIQNPLPSWALEILADYQNH